MWHHNPLRILGLFLIGAFVLLGPTAFSRSPQNPTPPSALRDDLVRILSLIDYINGDYREAVFPEGGGIKDAGEYREMQQFSNTCVTLFASLAPALDPTASQAISSYLSTLDAQIANKSPYHEIQATTELAKNQLIASFNISTGPQKAPNLQQALTNYRTTCSSCHGNDADGKGELSPHLDPAPRNFHDKDKAANSTPFKFFNSSLLGVPGTAMASFREHLSEEALWSISFYLAEIPYTKGQKLSGEQRSAAWETLPEVARSKLLAAGLCLNLLAVASEDDLLAWMEEKATEAMTILGEKGITSIELLKVLRSAAPYASEVPAKASGALEGEEASKGGNKPAQKTQQVLAGLQLARSKVAAAMQLFAQGDHAAAEKQLLDAYLFGFEKAEISLRLIKPALVKTIEGDFIETRTFAHNKDSSGFAQAIRTLQSNLEAAASTLSDNAGINKKVSAWGSFAGSMVIILREGFEAFLLIAALLALLSSMGASGAKRWVHAGWVAALIAGAVTYALVEGVVQISGAAKETIEAFSTGLAVVILFYTGFWLLSQSERMQWSRYIKDKTAIALTSGRLWGLFSISFIAVYREAAETLLFYAALYTTTSSPVLVTSGFLFGCVVLISICWGIVRYNVRLPVRQFFLITSYLMLTLSVTLAGKTVHELIEAGYIKATPLSWVPAIEVLGIYPSLETLLAQGLLLGVGLLLGWYLARKKKAKASQASSRA
jgi:high-affinity iron transporter